MSKLVRLVKLNNLQFNTNRDPQVYRRLPGEKFRIQAFLADAGNAQCTLRDASGAVIVTREVMAPASFEAEVSYREPGHHVVTLEVTRGAERFTQDLRLDVLAHAWIG
ncbi:MAG: hypothetical protein WCE38_21405 [Burkholderiales bacterium]